MNKFITLFFTLLISMTLAAASAYAHKNPRGTIRVINYCPHEIKLHLIKHIDIRGCGSKKRWSDSHKWPKTKTGHAHTFKKFVRVGCNYTLEYRLVMGYFEDVAVSKFFMPDTPDNMTIVIPSANFSCPVKLN